MKMYAILSGYGGIRFESLPDESDKWEPEELEDALDICSDEQWQNIKIDEENYQNIKYIYNEFRKVMKK